MRERKYYDRLYSDQKPKLNAIGAILKYFLDKMFVFIFLSYILFQVSVEFKFHLDT